MLRAVFAFVMLLMASVATAAPPAIRIVPGDWGSASIDDIHAVCNSAAVELWKHCAEDKPDPISVRNDQRGPMVIYGVGDSGERRVLLNTRDTYWSQYAFQFSHECCHILCNYRDGNKDNLWFEESLCETASLFALRSMAETWKTNPPYDNWKDYAASLKKYADDRLQAIDKVEGKSLQTWFAEHEAALRKNPTDRAKNQVVAARLLPLLEKDPSRWQALRSLNQGPADQPLTFAEYLRDWHRRVPEQHKTFVVEVGAIFEIDVTGK